jgi:hypothetical protein
LRIGFLFNHYAEHQVPHAAPYAFELSRRHPEMSVVLACSTRREMRMAKAIATLYPGHRCSFRRLHLALRARLASPFVCPWAARRKIRILRDNLDFFRSLDALVTPERTSLKLRTKFGLDHLLMVHTRHGAGDREGGFDDRSMNFDFTLLPGRKYEDRLKALGFLEDGKYAIVGWPKFDVVRGLQRPAGRLFQNTKPIVVYNPHFDQELSSWHSSGLEILDFFADTTDYNLIFAPHVLLFQRDRQWRKALKPYRRRPNMLLDCGSAASADMTYMLAADIYLGDVSSQVYEFLLQPRPCIFLNCHDAAWQQDPNYAHWRFGDVVDDVTAGLGPALEQARERHGAFVAEQTSAFHYTFRIESNSTAAERGAGVIAAFLQGNDKSFS